MSAEFAVTLPVVAAVIALSVGAVALATHQLRLTAAAADLARLEARGEDNSGETSVTASLGYPVTIQRERLADMHCVTLRANPGKGLLSMVVLNARGCALQASFEKNV